MNPRPVIFISAVSRELGSARQLVANTLSFLGYEPDWQEIFGTEEGDLRVILRRRIDAAKGVVQLVGQCYGAEPPSIDQEFGRVSYTQYEGLYARKRGRRVWYLFIDESFPTDTRESEPEELRDLQSVYRRRVQSDTHVFHSLTTTEGLEASILKLRDDLTKLRRGAKRWAIAIGVLVAMSVILGLWILQRQQRTAQEMGETKQALVSMQGKMDELLRKGVVEYPQVEAQVRGTRNETNPAAVQTQIYEQLAKDLGIDPKTLREKLPQFAAQLRKAPDAGTYERANASYLAKDYTDAERLALRAADEAQNLVPRDSKKILQAFELAGLSAHSAVQYTRAMEHFRDAEKFTDRSRNLDDWVTLQHDIGDLLVAQGKYHDAETLFRSVIDACVRFLGSEHPTTLDGRHRLIYTLTRQTKSSEAEGEAREVLKLREKVLGLQHVDTIVSRYNLADTLVEQGRYAEAEDLYRDVIRLDDKVLGPEHPGTLAARVCLAIVLGREGKNAEAEPLYREIIKLDEKIFGPEHPRTLNDRQNLAMSLQADAKYSEAEAEYREVINIDQKVIGPEHPDTLICRNNFAEMLDDAGKFAEAEAECRQIIALEEKALGPENRVTLNSRGNLAVALIAQGKFDEARVQYNDVMNLMERILGLEDPDTLGYATKFATALTHQNRREEAEELSKQLEEHARKLLGPDNSSTQGYAKLRQDLDLNK